RQRLIRASEVWIATGRSLSSWQDKPRVKPEGLDFRILTLMPERAVLVERIETRLRIMIERGALDEVRALLARISHGHAHETSDNLPVDAPVMKAIGVPELATYIRGESSLKDALTNATIATRRYAKRQTTWLRNRLAEHADLVLTDFGDSKNPETIQKYLKLLTITS
ncbi:MAG: tRNA dimethylallyltransferase, partial [Pseudomonadota bacterium]|nr:tRNA dimethylallyltransferase [Pseudomonadota bacterium]